MSRLADHLRAAGFDVISAAKDIGPTAGIEEVTVEPFIFQGEQEEFIAQMVRAGHPVIVDAELRIWVLSNGPLHSPEATIAVVTSKGRLLKAHKAVTEPLLAAVSAFYGIESPPETG